MLPESFRAFRVHERDGTVRSTLEFINIDDLSPGEVVVRVQFSSINYKDALAATGAGAILKRYPLVGGVDLAGIVVSSTDVHYQPGQPVLATGCGLSETRDGGYAEYARLPAEAVVPIPPGLDAYSAMALGTAGFTAALALHRMERNGQVPEGGPILVTGATGGVGSLAIDLFAHRGYEVVALTAKHQNDYLSRLGVARVIDRASVHRGTKPLERAEWGGAVDNLGGEWLAWLTRTVKPWGNIASIGLASGSQLQTTVMPFILRGINLLGINSSATPRPERLAVWNRLATDLRPRHLDQVVTRVLPFEALPEAFAAYLRGEITGRTLVRIGQ